MEARTFGLVISRCAAALKEATGAEFVYVSIFGGGMPHLHVHLAPHTSGDALNDAMLKGQFEERPMESGATMLVSKDYPDVPVERLRAVVSRARGRRADAEETLDRGLPPPHPLIAHQLRTSYAHADSPRANPCRSRGERDANTFSSGAAR